MKRILGILGVVLFLVLVVGTGVFLYRKSATPDVVYETESPAKATIVKKTVATGSVVPRQEVAVKPLVSGIVEEIYVEPGEQIEKGAMIARVRLIPDMVNLNNAETRLNRARLSLDNARKD